MHPTTTPGPPDSRPGPPGFGHHPAGYGHPAPGHPVPLPPPPARRSRGGLVAAIVGGVVALLAVAGAVLAFTGFFAPVVERQDVAAGISTQLAGRGVTASSVDCPDDLPAEVGASVRCTYAVEGGPIGVSARVSSLQGDQAIFDVTSEAPLVAREDVAAAIDEYAAAVDHAVDAPTSCPAALIGVVGRSTRCEFTVGGQPVDAVATVTAATATSAEFDIALQARPVDRELVEQDVAYLVTQNYDAQVDGVDCAGDLPAEVGESVLCTLTGGGEQLDLRVSVAAIEDGLVGYDIQQA